VLFLFLLFSGYCGEQFVLVFVVLDGGGGSGFFFFFGFFAFCLILFCFLSQCLEQPRLASNYRSSCLSLLSVGIIGTNHHAQLILVLVRF
jgi:hypothetical protein